MQPVQLYGFSKSRLYEPLGTAIFFRNRFCPVSWILVFLPVHFYGYSLILTLEHIDDLMAYRFYLAVNNPEVQEKELKRFAGDYRGCFKLYKIWTAYRKEKGYEIHQEQTALDKWEDFEKYAAV